MTTRVPAPAPNHPSPLSSVRKLRSYEPRGDPATNPRSSISRLTIARLP